MINHHLTKLRRSALLGSAATLLAGFALGTGVYAQDAGADAEEELEEVTVTGSRIVRRDLSAVSPVNIVSQQDLQLAGNINIDRTLNELPAINPSATTTTNNGGEGIATVDLRELQPERTLVLQNGRRMIGSNTALQVDINNIPAVLIERVEVLTGGASAIYGSDAVAGVVNFVLRDDFEGISAGGQYNLTERGDADTRTLDFTIGGNFADGKGNAVLHTSFTDRQSLLQADRSWANESLGDFGDGEFVPFGSSRLVGGRAGGGVPIDLPDGSTGVSLIGFNPDGSGRDAGGESFNFAPFQFLQTPQERIQFSGLAHYELNESSRVYFEGLYSNNRVDLTLAPDANDIPDGIAPLFVPSTNPLIPQQTMDILLAAFDTGQNGDAVAGDGIASIPDFRRRMDDVGSRNELRDFDLYRMVVGVDGDLSDNWRYDAYYSYGRVNRSFRLVNYTSDIRIQQAINATTDANGDAVCIDPTGNCVPINLFGDGALSPEGAAFISPDANQVSFNEQNIFHANVSGTIDQLDLGAGPVGLALGGEYREEVAAFLPDAVSQTGELGPGNDFQVTEGSFDVWEIFGEALIPLLSDVAGAKSLDLELAARWSDYSSVGSVWSYSAGLQWQPVDSLRVRGGYQRAVRAPNIAELFGGAAAGASPTTDPCDAGRLAANPQFVDICRATGVPEGYTQLDSQATRITGGNPNVEEERADTFTVGVVFTPEALPGFSMTVDYFNIEIENAITDLTSTAVLDLCVASGDPNNINCQNVTRTFNGDIIQILAPTENIASEKREGIDWQIQYAFALGNGELSLQNIGTYFITNEFTSSPLSDPTDCNGIFGGGCTGLGDFTAPEWRLTQNITYSFDKWVIRLQGRMISAIDNADAVADPDALFAQPQIAENFYGDLTFTYQVNENFMLSGGVENFTDNEPPIMGFFRNVAAGTDPSLYDVLGRSYFLGGRLTF